MQLKIKRKLFSLLVVFSLVFSLGTNTFALEDLPADVNTPAKVVLDSGVDSNIATPPALEVTPDALEISTPAAIEATPAALKATSAGIEVTPAVTPPALAVTTAALEVTPTALEVATPGVISIKSVEVLNGGDVQILYRSEVYKGVEANGEDPNKFYTTRREINLKDPRIFNVEFTVPAEGITDSQAFLNSVDFTYGGFPLSSWGNGKDLRGKTAIMQLFNKKINPVADGYKVSASIRVDSPYGEGSKADAAFNTPYNGYNAGGQRDFGNGQTADNRAFFQFGPTQKGPDTYALEAVATGKSLASTNLHIGPYDGYHSWIEINEFCQDLITALNGEPADVDSKPLGVIASGTVIKNTEGKFEKGDGVYIEVSILGYGLTDNYYATNKVYNNYSRFNPIWNVVVAKDSKTVDDYIKPGGFKDQMNDNPQALIDKYKDANPEDIDFVTPFYQNNVHSDEISGTDSMINLINEMIEGGKDGKTINYKTFQNNQINWNYRPSGIENEDYEVFNHIVNGEQFESNSSRTSESIDTEEVLDKFIMVNTLCSNPDGKAAMRRVNRYGIDLNRDTVFATQPETIALTQDIAKWDPLVLLEWHGYVTQMLIEPCTAPHSMNYEPDLTLNNMIQLAYEGGKALTGSTGFNRFHLPWDSMSSGWDDGGNVYGPMFAMLYGCMGWTIELPFSNSDGFEAGNAIDYAMLNALMKGETAYYDGNVLNGRIDGKDRHKVDNKYSSLRKSTIMNKLEFKLRGVENIDSPDADKYFIDVVDGVAKYVGRARKDDGNGEKLPFFPDYLIIPGTPANQFNVAEAYRTLDFTMSYGAKVSKTTEPVTYNGVTYPAGTYLYDMKQGRRNFIAEIMSKGYDATNFASMYADIYCNFPDTRGFDCVEVWSQGLFDGKTEPVASIDKKADIAGTPADYVVFKSNSVDSVRFVNLLLSGRSSGPSFIDSKENVWMLRKSVDGVGTMSDYIIEAKNLDKINALVDNPNLGLKGCQIEGQYISNLPKEAVKLVEPIINMNSTRDAATKGGPIYWVLDDYMGFGSMKNADGTDYNGNSSSTVRPNANVALMYNAAANGNLLTAIKNDKLGLVMVQSAASLTNANFGTENTTAPTTGTFNDVALYGQYNVDDSLFTANYANTNTIYARGNYFTGNIPAGSKILFRSKDGGAFIGGYQATNGSKDIFQNKTTMFSTILTGGGITGKPVQSVTFGSNMFFRPHYQKYYPMLATAIFAGAAGILDDQASPVINSIDISNTKVVINASDAGSGMAMYTLYKWNAATKEYALEAKQDNGTFNLASGENGYRIVVTDYVGNEVTKEFTAKYIYSSGGGGGGSGSSSVVSSTIPAAGGAVQVSYTASGSTASLTLPDAKVKEVIGKVKSGEAIFDLSKASGITAVELPKAALSAIEDAGLGIMLKLPAGTISLDKAATASVLEKVSGNSLKLELKKIASSTLTADQKKAIKDSDVVIDINIFDGTKKISNFDGKLSIQVPYSGTLPVSVWYLNDKGELEKLDCTFKDGIVSFTLDHLSLYVIGQEAKSDGNLFTDVKTGDWFCDAVQYVNKNGLMKGTNEKPMMFSPNASTTRGMVVTILYRMAGSPAVTAANPFDDVAAGQYYTDAVIWASNNKVVTGYGNGKFGPNNSITREQMASILLNYAKLKGYDVSAKANISGFDDVASVSGWANDSLSWANAKGLIQGSGNKLTPGGNAERCQVAAILQRFVEMYKN